MKFNTIKEAAENWVREFDRIPMGVVEKLMNFAGDFEGVNEVTPPSRYDRVDVYAGKYSGESGEIVKCDERGYLVAFDNGERHYVDECDMDVWHGDGYLPMWGTMWAFSDPCDKDWLESHMQEMADCGFRIYEQEDYGYIFGIDGAGYDFYEQHWIPLYKVRGLKWHKMA